MKHYMIICQGFTYASDIYGKNKRDAINNFKKLACIDRMPNGFAIWLA